MNKKDNRIVRIVQGLYFYVVLWIYAILKEVISRVLSIVFFPIAYLMRDRLRAHLYSIDEELVKNRTFYDATMNPDGTPSYDASDTDKYFPEWVTNTKWRWLRDIWWSFIRNNTVNYVSWYRTGGIIFDTVESDDEIILGENYETYWGKFDWYIDKNDRNTRRFR